MIHQDTTIEQLHTADFQSETTVTVFPSGSVARAGVDDGSVIARTLFGMSVEAIEVRGYRSLIAFMDEYGPDRGLAANPVASAIIGQPVVGPVVFMGGEPILDLFDV